MYTPLPALSSPPTSPLPAPPTPVATGPLTAEQAFDSIGARYEAAFANLPTQAASLRWLLSGLEPLGRPARILDVGCGTGNPVASTLADAGHDVLGIDVSAKMIAACRANVPGAEFRQVDVRAFLKSAERETYDAVTVYFSLIASITQAEIRATLKRLAGLLKPGGLLVWATVPLEAEELEIKWMGRPVVVSSLGVERAVEAVREAGLVVEWKGTSAFLPRGEEAGICEGSEVWEEPHLFVYARKGPGDNGEM